jgi:hypothetical protein
MFVDALIVILFLVLAALIALMAVVGIDHERFNCVENLGHKKSLDDAGR